MIRGLTIKGNRLTVQGKAINLIPVEYEDDYEDDDED